MYGDKRMCNLFHLNYNAPSYSQVKRDNKKGVHFVHGKHAWIFAFVANIYTDAKDRYGIDNLVPVILVEDEPKLSQGLHMSREWIYLLVFVG